MSVYFALPRPFWSLSRSAIRVSRCLLSGAQRSNVRHFRSTGIAQQQLAQQTESIKPNEPPRARETSSKAKYGITLDIGRNQQTISSVFLRDSCTCPLCIDPSNRQKLFQTADIPEAIQPIWNFVENGSTIEITWENDVPGYPNHHRTRHSVEWLARDAHHEAAIDDERIFWDRKIITRDNKWVDYDQYMKSDKVFYESLKHLRKYGLLFVKNVPDSEKSVEHIAGRVGVLRDSFYGRTWDVKSKPNAKNIAYTHQFLGLHMDLLYMTNPPHLQLLHCLRARSPGGASMFSDSFYAASKLRAAHLRNHFNSLTTFPVTYHYHNDSQYYHFERPTIELDPLSQEIKNVNWSPPFQGPFNPKHFTHAGDPDTRLKQYHQAAAAFNEIICNESSLFEYRLDEGDCVIFDNRRVLHARRAFDASKGERWLKGAYVDDDVYFSKLRVLQEKFSRP